MPGGLGAGPGNSHVMIYAESVIISQLKLIYIELLDKKEKS